MPGSHNIRKKENWDTEERIEGYSDGDTLEAGIAGCLSRKGWMGGTLVRQWRVGAQDVLE